MFKYWIYRLIRFAARVAPVKITYLAANLLGDINYLFANSTKKAIKKNISVVLGKNVDDPEVLYYARKSFRNFAKYIVGFCRGSDLVKKEIGNKIYVEGTDNLDRALDKGKGVIVITAHLGNWELAAGVTAGVGYKVAAVTMTHEQERVNSLFVELRHRMGVEVIPLGMTVRKCFEVIRDNKLLALACDRDLTENGLDVDFFGKRAVLPKGPAVLALRTGAPIVPGLLLREDDGRFRLVFEDAIYVEKGRPSEDEVRKLMYRYLGTVEEYIRRYPGQWFVFYPVWKDEDFSFDSVLQ